MRRMPMAERNSVRAVHTRFNPFMNRPHQPP
jgi:hypothetical protein